MSASLTQTSFADQRILVVGLGRFGGGVAVTRWLVRQGARVTVTDQADERSLAKSIAALRDVDVKFELGGHDVRDLDETDLVVLNPAVNKVTSSFFSEIERRGVPWTTELNLFCARCPACVIGVTGSYGKSTTSVMLYDVLGACRGRDPDRWTGVRLGGNIGHSLLNELVHIRSTDIIVLEMSNAQLEDLPRIAWTPDVAVITNLYPHHLDRYGGFEDYARAKLNILRREPRRDGREARSAHGDDRQRVIMGDIAPAADQWIAASLDDQLHSVTRVTPAEPAPELRVPGRHNLANAACVLAVARVLGLDQRTARDALEAFRGLPHRMEFVATINGVDYYNDSKSTSPSATVVALDCIDRPIVAIVGGQRKPDQGRGGCVRALLAKSRAVICTGESGSDFAEALERQAATDAHGASGVDIRLVASLEEAVSAAQALACRGDVVLFSPGAPSFDTFANFAERGERFTSAVRRMATGRA